MCYVSNKENKQRIDILSDMLSFICFFLFQPITKYCNAVLEPRTEHFRGLVGFKAKNLSCEAKAKDLKMCPEGRPRGQGRPQRLHLCRIAYGCPHYKRKAICHSFCKVLLPKNRLFSKKSLPLRKPLRSV